MFAQDGQVTLTAGRKDFSLFEFSWKTVLFIYCLTSLQPHDTESLLGDLPA